MTATVTGHTPVVGTPIDRVDGRLKVSGQAQYAADTPVEHVAYAVMVTSTIAHGKIVSFDTAAAGEIHGVLKIFTHENSPRFTQPEADFMKAIVPAQTFMPMQGPQIVHYGQQIAVVVAETFEAARAAAARVRVTYEPGHALLSFDDPKAGRTKPEQFFGSALQTERGDVDKQLASAPVKLDEQYSTPTQFHNPMEPHATVAQWNGDKLTIHEPSQWVKGLQQYVAIVFDVAVDNVHIVSPFVGGGFGNKGFSFPHTIFAAMAARELKRPVKLVLTRTQLFEQTGNRPRTEQHIRIGAQKDGKLVAIDHASTIGTSVAGWFVEPSGRITSMLYSCPNVRISHEAVWLNTPAPGPMRAPGETPGTFALESALDELAAKLGIDPIELRVKNDATQDEEEKLPFSSRHLVECLRVGATRFGWKDRPRKARERREHNEYVGYGVATATFPGLRSPASARVRRDGDNFLVEVATHDIGTGMYSIIAQVAADALGVGIEQIEVRIGDSTLPPAPVAGGSMSTASVMPAVQAACLKLRESGKNRAEASSAPGDEQGRYSFHSFGAQFVEVRVDERLGHVRVARALGVFDCGKIINPKTTRSQFLGGMVFGIGMALMEGGRFDERSGRVMTDNLADYRIPVNADIGEIEAITVEHPDFLLNPLGVRGVGEIGTTGIAAAIANAVYNATGKRIRELPITPDKLL
jgi:xanthine dehydrogenase YagR molybdenum-binding subunit